MAQPTVSDAVRVLVDKGLLSRTVDPDDRRSRRLRPSAPAAGVARRTDPTQAVAGLLEGVDRDRAATSLGVALDLIAAMEAAGMISRVATCTTCRFFARDRHPDPAAPHHCRLLDAPLRPGDLRVDCPEHQQAG